MVDTFLVPQKTTVTAKGDGPVVDISGAGNRVFLLQLEITGIVEQESLDVSVFGGPDEQNIGKAPLASFPQRFYRGQYPLLLDLSGHLEVKVLRAHWEVNRWGRGSDTPWFEFGVKVTEVSPELLREREMQAE
ncbi:MAG: hypothetical protein ACE14L_13435 [Terriglobales bacterium]